MRSHILSTAASFRSAWSRSYYRSALRDLLSLTPILAVERWRSQQKVSPGLRFMGLIWTALLQERLYQTRPVVPVLRRTAPDDQPSAASALTLSLFIEVLILETDAGEIPAISAISRTPLPATRNCLAFSTFGLAIGGRPNLIDRLVQPPDHARCDPAAIVAGGAPEARRHRTAIVHSRSRYRSSPHANSQRHGRAAGLHEPDQIDEGFPDPADGPDKHPVDCAGSDRVYQRHFTWASILILSHRCRTVSDTFVTVHSRSAATFLRCFFCSSAVRGQSGLDRA